MTTNTEVKVFQSTNASAPTLSGTAGTLITVLDACLVNGYGSVTLDSITVTSNVATCTKSTGHGFTALGTVGPVIRVSGATPAGLNADWRITVVSSTVFTFVTTGISDQTATGTIDAKRAPAGFSKAFGNTVKAAYRSDDVTGTRLYLRVSDEGTGSAAYTRVIAYEAMTAIDTGTFPFPTEAQQSGGGYWHKSSAASGTARPWTIIADSAAFYLFVQQDGAVTGQIGVMFGDINSDYSGDAYRAMLVFGTNVTASNGGPLPLYNATLGRAMARSYLGTGTAIQPIQYGPQFQTSGMGYAGATYPNPGNNWFLCNGVDVWDSASVARGTLPGLYAPLHAASSLTDNATQTTLAGLPGREMVIKRMVNGGSNYACAVDITGPWRS